MIHASIRGTDTRTLAPHFDALMWINSKYEERTQITDAEDPPGCTTASSRIQVNGRKARGGSEEKLEKGTLTIERVFTGL